VGWVPAGLASAPRPGCEGGETTARVGRGVGGATTARVAVVGCDRSPSESRSGSCRPSSPTRAARVARDAADRADPLAAERISPCAWCSPPVASSPSTPVPARAGARRPAGLGSKRLGRRATTIGARWVARATRRSKTSLTGHRPGERGRGRRGAAPPRAAAPRSRTSRRRLPARRRRPAGRAPRRRPDRPAGRPGRPRP